MTESALFFKRGFGASTPVTVTASPFVYTNVSVGIQLISITGGVVTLLEANLGLGFVVVPTLTSLMPNQSVRITYLVTPPTVTTIQL